MDKKYIKKFKVFVATEHGVIIEHLNIGIFKDWDDVPVDSDPELEFDNCFDHSEIKSTSVKAVPSIEDNICKIIKDHMESRNEI